MSGLRERFHLHNWVDMSARDFETSDIHNHLAVLHRMALPGGFSREQLLTVHDRQEHMEWGKQPAVPGLTSLHEDWWNDQLLAKKVEHLVGDHDVDVRTVDSGIDAHTGKVGAEIGALHLRLHGVLHDRHPENFDISRQVESIRAALADPSKHPALSDGDRTHVWMYGNWSNIHKVRHLAEHDPDLVLPAWHDGDGVLDKIHLDYHTHVRNPRKIELTMPDTVTVILDMTEEHALCLQEMLDERTRNIANGFHADEAFLLVDNGKIKMKLSADIRKVGSLPEPEEAKPEGLPISATTATMPRANTVEVPIYVRDTQRWVKWHPMAMRYLDTEEPDCIGDTDGDGDCPLSLCPRCGPKRGTL